MLMAFNRRRPEASRRWPSSPVLRLQSQKPNFEPRIYPKPSHQSLVVQLISSNGWISTHVIDVIETPTLTASMERNRGVFSSMHLPKWVTKAWEVGSTAAKDRLQFDPNFLGTHQRGQKLHPHPKMGWLGWWVRTFFWDFKNESAPPIKCRPTWKKFQKMIWSWSKTV